MTTPLKVLDCGHEPTPDSSPGTGVAVDSKTGEKLCYACGDERKRGRIETADEFVGYVDEGRRVITTWSGGELAKIRHLHTGAAQYTPSGGRYRMRTVEAVTPDGAHWRGRGGDGMDVITMRRVKG